MELAFNANFPLSAFLMSPDKSPAKFTNSESVCHANSKTTVNSHGAVKHGLDASDVPNQTLDCLTAQLSERFQS